MPLSEREFEDWTCANLERVTGYADVALLRRQVKLPTGRILDVLAIREAKDRIILYVIELKAVPADEDAVVQLLDYMSTMVDCVAMLRLQFLVRNEQRPVEIRGMLAAPGLSERARRVLIALPNIEYVALTVTIGVQRPELISPVDVDGLEWLPAAVAPEILAKPDAVGDEDLWFSMVEADLDDFGLVPVGANELADELF